MKVTLIIMAAGLGSRYGGIKQMAGVGPGGEILLEYAVYDALRAGFDKIAVVLRPDIVEDFRERVGEKLARHCEIVCPTQDFSSLPGFFTLPEGRQKPMGTIHAVLCAREAVEGPFGVLNADDYYGPEAFRLLYQALTELPPEGEACMAAYRLKNTVSPSGVVTRGICEVEDGFLRSIDETRNVLLSPDGSIHSGERLLDGERPVSMNFFGFAPSAMEDMSRYFDGFLRALSPEDMKSECLLPDYTAARIREKALRVRVLETTESWFGMTYEADRRSTAESLARLHARGLYPPRLFD